MKPAGVLAALWCLLPAAGVAAADERVDYARQVKPLLTARCTACHGGLQQKNGLRLDTVALLKKGGDHGPAVAPGDSAKSLMMAHLTGAGGARRMPPAGEGEPLKDAEVALLRAWIDQGAAGPADEKPEADPRDHWAFKAPVRPPVPPGGRTPIDAFLAAERAKRGLKPQPPADKALLLRRVHLDLIGLPPTPAEQAAFLKDESPDAYETVVDRLLASPHYGERWGRHWLDVWRYGDWWGLGAELRNSQKHLWHWRDWTVEALNADKGYDQMVREMLAADELYPDDPGRLRATGYLARSYFKFNRNTWLDEVVEHTAKGFLGLTINCAKCHDHKYDPFAQQDYYRLRAFFEPYQLRTDMVPGEADFEKGGIPRAFDCNADAPTYLFVRGDERQPKKTRPLEPGLPEVLSPGKLTITPVTLPAAAHTPGLRPFVVENHLREAARRIAAAHAALEKARRDAKDTEKDRHAVAAAEKALAAAALHADAVTARAAADRARTTDTARAAARAERRAALATAEENLARAELELAGAAADKKAAAETKRKAAHDAVAAAAKALDNPGETYTPLRGALKTLESNVESEASRNKPFPTTSTGRRTALAAWATDRRNPLAARVAVNHVWMRHFGQPLVPTVFDFGRKGTPPTHPELLDWLAVEFMDGGWSMKRLHRVLVTSDAYRLSSSSAGAAAANTAADPENRFYWRMNPVRMQAEVVRDSLLHLAGELDLTTGGPPVPATAEDSRRRSLYFFHSHTVSPKFLALFDDAGVLECYRRAESILPQQALALENSRLAMDAAEKIAARLDGDTDDAFVRAGFHTLLGYAPNAAEAAACAAALKEWRAIAANEKRPDPARRARTNLIHALLNHNDFVTIR